MCANLPKTTPLGNEVDTLLEAYSKKNLTQRFNPNKLQFDLLNYLKFFPDPCMAKELNQIFCEQFT